MFITWLWIRAVPPPMHRTAPHRTLPWRGDDDSNCMYYTTTCNTMGHGSIGLTLSMPARLAACLAFARVRAASHCPLPAQRMIQDDESEVVWGDPDHRLMTMRHLSDELICPAHTTPPQPLATTRGLGLALPSSPHDAHAHFPLLSCDGGRPSHGRATLLLRGRPEAYDKFR